jgi:DNA helicase-2/ATP-dependent DNA helicase PcrA
MNEHKAQADLTIEDLWKLTGFAPNEHQEQAILHVDGPLYLPAGPGSGKTRVLLWRTLNLIVFHGVKPDEIYLSTFTKKAAHQLQEGIRALLSIVTNHTNLPYDISGMYVGTIHSLCQRLILDRRLWEGQSRPDTPSLLDDLSQYFYLSRYRCWNHLVEDLGFGSEAEEIHRAINAYFGDNSASQYKAVVNCMALFNRFSEECLDPDQVDGRIQDQELRDLLTMYRRYLDFLATQEKVPRTDFSLLQQAAYKRLESLPNPPHLFSHVIIDEYQDTNPIQEKLIFKLGESSKNICVVGDDDQALYRFRGATVENFVNFPEKCLEILGVDPNIVPLGTNYRSRKKIVDLYSDFIRCCDWHRYRVPKEITAHRVDESPSVVASTPGSPEEVCPQVARLVKDLLDSGKVENENQIAFLFPSLKSDQVGRLKKALEDLGLKVYAPRAGRFLEVEESVDVFGVFLHIFGKPSRRDFGGRDYKEYHDWIARAYQNAQDLLDADPILKRYVKDRQVEIELVKNDYQIMQQVIVRQGWELSQPYYRENMKRPLSDAPGLSERARKSLVNAYFDRLVMQRSQTRNPIRLDYVLKRATSLDWNVLDLFYRLCGFTHFKQMFDLAESGDAVHGADEGPICNLSLISQYLFRFMDEYSPLIIADLLLEDHLTESTQFQRLLFGRFLYAIFRLGESEYENAEDPFPKGRIPFLTIHQAKGLEFPMVVFGNPRKRLRLQEIESIVNPLLDRQGEPLERIPQFDMMRLFYVALSRAKNLLVIPHWQSQGNYVSEPLKSLLEDEHILRIPDFDISTLPETRLEKEDLPKNYSYTADYLHYQKCPRQYMIFRKYEFVPSRSQTMFFGSLVHRTLEDLHRLLISMRSSE